MYCSAHEKGATAGVDVRWRSWNKDRSPISSCQHGRNRCSCSHLWGSAFGLDTACGAMQYLERDIGYDVQVTKVPIVCAAILFDLTVGDYRVRPDKQMGYTACQNAGNRECLQGNIGAGTGATVGKIRGMEKAMKGGLGASCLQAGELKVGALVAVNCLGDVLDPTTGEIIAGALNDDRKTFAGTENVLLQMQQTARSKDLSMENTTLGIVATNGRFTKTQMNKIASIAHNGLARTIKPAHTMFDGDTIFALATGKVEANINLVGARAATAVERVLSTLKCLFRFPLKISDKPPTSKKKSCHQHDLKRNIGSIARKDLGAVVLSANKL